MRNLIPVLLDKELKLLAQEGPSLAHFTKLSEIHQFLPISNLKLIETIKLTPQMDTIQLKNNSNNNIRAFYTAMLLIIYHNQKVRQKYQILTKFKQLVYSQNINFCQFFKSEISSETQQKNKIIKKLIIEFLEILKRSEKSSIFEILENYPIADIILTMIFRLISCNLCKNQADYLNFNTKIDTRTLVLVFMIKLNIKIVLNAGNYVFPDINYSIKETNESIYMIFNENHLQSSLKLHQENQSYVILSPQFKQTTQICNMENQFIENDQQPQFSFAKLVFSQKNIASQKNLKESIILEKYQFHQINNNQLQYNIKKYQFNSKPSIQIHNISDNILPQPSHTSTKMSSQKPIDTKYLLDGLTSNQVINIMSPKIVDLINQKKKQSMMTIFGTTQDKAKKLLVKKDTLSEFQQKDIPNNQINIQNQQKQLRLSKLRKSIQQIRNRKKSLKKSQRKQTRSLNKQQTTVKDKKIQPTIHKVNNIKISFTYGNPKPRNTNPPQRYHNLYPYKTQNTIKLPFENFIKPQQKRFRQNPRKIYGQFVPKQNFLGIYNSFLKY